MKTSDIIFLEQLIDQEGLTEVMAQLASICCDKAEHITVSYSDTVLAKKWQDSAALFVQLLDLLPT